MSPYLVQTAGNKINKVKGIQQAITQDRKEAERIGLLITIQVIEDLYKTPLCLLGNFGKRKYNQFLRKVKKIGAVRRRRK